MITLSECESNWEIPYYSIFGTCHGNSYWDWTQEVSREVVRFWWERSLNLNLKRMKTVFQFPKRINYWTNESIIDFKIILNLEFRRALFRVFDPLGLRVCTPFLIRVQRAKSSLTAVLGISCLKSSGQWHWKTRVNTLIMIPCVPYVWIMG